MHPCSGTRGRGETDPYLWNVRMDKPLRNVWSSRQLEGPASGSDNEEGEVGQTIRLGIDVACRAEHQASCADATGDFLWSGWRFRTTTAELERLWAKLPEDAEVT